MNAVEASSQDRIEALHELRTMGVLTAAELEEELSIGYDRGRNDRRLTELGWARRILPRRFMRVAALDRRSSSVAGGSAA